MSEVNNETSTTTSPLAYLGNLHIKQNGDYVNTTVLHSAQQLINQILESSSDSTSTKIFKDENLETKFLALLSAQTTVQPVQWITMQENQIGTTNFYSLDIAFGKTTGTGTGGST